MDKRKLNLEMENYTTSGLFLAIEEQHIMKISLPLLKMSNYFESVHFWGKIFGDDKDYYVAQGFVKDFIRNKMTYYSLDGKLWRFLYPPKDKDLAQLHLVRDRFTGDPSTYHSYLDPGLDFGEPDNKDYMKEEDRLSALVKMVDIEAAIVPKESFVLDQKSLVKPSLGFKGLSPIDAVKLNSYVHFRLPDLDIILAPREDFCPPGSNRATNFLEPIDRDVPKGCWTLHADEAIEMVVLRNLWWPGYMFYHKPNTSEYGSIYMGYGERNDDLPFML